jgi:hypothetical protein
MDFQVQLVHKVRQEQQGLQAVAQVVHKVRQEQQDLQAVVQLEHKVQPARTVHGVRQEQLVRKVRVVHVVKREQLDLRKLPTFQSPLGHYKQQLHLDLHLQVDLDYLKQGSRIKFRFSFGERQTARILPMDWSF